MHPQIWGLSAYNHLDADINYSTGEIVRPYTDPNSLSLPAPESGLNNNAIGRSVPTLEDIPPTGIWVDAQRYLYSPVWANSTEWIAFFTEAGEQGTIAGWQVVPRDGIITEKALIPLPASAREVFGTPQGLLVIDIENNVSHITTLDLVEGTLLYQSPQAQLAQVVYVSEETGAFLLTGVGAPDVTVDAMPEDTTTISDALTVIPSSPDEPTVFCEGTLPSILQIGSSAQVSNTDGIPLRVREAPGGAVLTEITEGTQFDVLGGPECFDGYTWWQIELASGTTGWSAEGDNEDYWVAVVTAPTAVSTETVASTATPIPSEAVTNTTSEEATPVPTVAQDTTGEDTTEEIVDTSVGDGNCDASPESRINVGMNVTVQAAGGSLAFRANPLDSAPVAQLPDQTILPVVGGPACRTGYRQWQVRATIDGVLRDGWVSEGTLTRYFLEPTE